MLNEVSFGEWLKRQRNVRGLIRDQLAQQIGCAVVTLRKIEAEERRPSAQIVERLAEIFSIPQNERTAFLRFARGDLQAAPPMESEAAPWRARTIPSRSVLPAPLISLIGREHEVDEIQEYLSNPSIRLVTLVGPPGIGKTSLSLVVAREVIGRFDDGAIFVQLATLDDSNLVAPTIIQALGFVETKQNSSIEHITVGIGTKTMLIVLDNFEHLINGAASLVPDLLSACVNLKVLVTSREALRVPGEWLYSVPPLSLPEDAAETKPDRLSQYSAVRLFAERARAVRSDFALNAENIHAVTAICAELNGLPLAIELIAARIRLMSPEALLTKLNDQFVLYADGIRALPSRQKSLHSAIDWSYNLLSTDEKNLFVRLAVFSGGFGLEAIESIFSRTVIHKSVTDLVSALLDKSLIQRVLNERGEPRFYMLVTIQHFALNHLRMRNEENEARGWHFDYFLDLAEAGEPNMSGHGLLEWLPRLQVEGDNFRAAFEWGLASHTHPERSLRLANALFHYWRVRSAFHEAQHWLDRVLNLPGTKNYRTAYAKALLSMGNLQLIYASPEAAEPLLWQCITLARPLKDPRILAGALDFLGLASAFQKKFEQAHTSLEESQSLFRAANDRQGLALTTWHLGVLAALEGIPSVAFEYHEQALVLFQEVGDLLRQSVVLRNLGRFHLDVGEIKQGNAILRQALNLARRLDSKLEMGHSFFELSRAEQLMERFTRAAQFLSMAQRLCLDCGAQSDLLSVEREFDRLKTHLDHSSLEAAIAQAETWTLNEAFTYALEEDGGLI